MKLVKTIKAEYMVEKITPVLEGSDFKGTILIHIECSNLNGVHSNVPDCTKFTIETVDISEEPDNYYDFRDDEGYIFRFDDYTNSLYNDKEEFLKDFIPYFINYCKTNNLINFGLRCSDCNKEYDYIYEDIMNSKYEGSFGDLWNNRLNDVMKLDWKFDIENNILELKNNILSKSYNIEYGEDEYKFSDELFRIMRSYNIAWNKEIMKIHNIKEEE